jgi:DNA-directed RNA polymerase I subunit RPA34.5
MLGEPILSHKGVDYGLVANAQQQKQGSEILLVYDEVTNTFVRKPELKNIESYNIQEIVRLPGLDSLVPETSKKQQSKARPQPKHLRMRFHPVGSQNLPPETVGSSSESEAEEPTFRVPRKDEKEKNEKDLKRKADSEDTSEAKSKKSKKEKPSSQETDTRRDKEKNSSKHRDETSEERRARKEEKKKRKAEKAH